MNHLDIKQFKHGQSNPTYLLQVSGVVQWWMIGPQDGLYCLQMKFY